MQLTPIDPPAAPRARPRRLRAIAPLSVCAVFAAVGCSELVASPARIARLSRSIVAATRAGAYTCAPEELALARANVEFAQMELAQGDPTRAAQHLDVAEENIGAAEVLIPHSLCAGNSSRVSEQLNTPAALDRDGDGIPDAVDRCPDEPEDKDGHLDADGCIDADNDADGVPDAIDACPNDAEDHDNFADEDGCPDPDNDADGVVDAQDACPDSPGRIETHGCPSKSYAGLSVGERELRLASPIVFGAAATIRSVSYTALDSIAQLLRDERRMTLEIGGHTDSRGDAERNLVLSQQQADSVRNYLIEHGVEATRLTARGYGETRPIESNSTSRGRAINRRVEFVRTDRAQ
jgi:OOP family OmpA-OmpF porin